MNHHRPDRPRRRPDYQYDHAPFGLYSVWFREAVVAGPDLKRRGYRLYWNPDRGRLEGGDGDPMQGYIQEAYLKFHRGRPPASHYKAGARCTCCPVHAPRAHHGRSFA